jgi:short chain dehydrogenase
MSRILVTGATRGLGRALVNELSRRDHEVVATGRRAEDMADLPASDRLVLDLTNPESIDSAMAAAGTLDVVINNAAMTVSGPVEAVPANLAGQVLATNVLGPLRVMQAALPAMRRRGYGRIMNISTPAGRFAPPLEGGRAGCGTGCRRPGVRAGSGRCRSCRCRGSAVGRPWWVLRRIALACRGGLCSRRRSFGQPGLVDGLYDQADPVGVIPGAPAGAGVLFDRGRRVASYLWRGGQGAPALPRRGGTRTGWWRRRPAARPRRPARSGWLRR